MPTIARMISDTLAGLSDVSALDALLCGRGSIMDLDLDPSLPIAIDPIAQDLTSQIENIDRMVYDSTPSDLANTRRQIAYQQKVLSRYLRTRADMG